LKRRRSETRNVPVRGIIVTRVDRTSINVGQISKSVAKVARRAQESHRQRRKEKIVKRRE